MIGGVLAGSEAFGVLVGCVDGDPLAGVEGWLAVGLPVGPCDVPDAAP